MDLITQQQEAQLGWLTGFAVTSPEEEANICDANEREMQMFEEADGKLSQADKNNELIVFDSGGGSFQIMQKNHCDD